MVSSSLDLKGFFVFCLDGATSRCIWDHSFSSNAYNSIVIAVVCCYSVWRQCNWTTRALMLVSISPDKQRGGIGSGEDLWSIAGKESMSIILEAVPSRVKLKWIKRYTWFSDLAKVWVPTQHYPIPCLLQVIQTSSFIVQPQGFNLFSSHLGKFQLLAQ